MRQIHLNWEKAEHNRPNPAQPCLRVADGTNEVPCLAREAGIKYPTGVGHTYTHSPVLMLCCRVQRLPGEPQEAEWLPAARMLKNKQPKKKKPPAKQPKTYKAWRRTAPYREACFQIQVLCLTNQGSLCFSDWYRSKCLYAPVRAMKKTPVDLSRHCY